LWGGRTSDSHSAEEGNRNPARSGKTKNKHKKTDPSYRTDSQRLRFLEKSSEGKGRSKHWLAVTTNVQRKGQGHGEKKWEKELGEGVQEIRPD